jgi:hypothetical protein
MGLQPLVNQGPHSMVEIFVSRMHVLRNIVCILLLDVHIHNIHTVVYLFFMVCGLFIIIYFFPQEYL